jgi:tetratricopeptide (TPR) repeat protein
MYGSSLYDYGYLPYDNVYYAPTTVAAVPYDYAQPIGTTQGAPPAASVQDEAQTLFSSARDAFKQGSYESALRMADDALAKTPNDTALHEFRALCLFAMRRYDEAATTLYAVLSVGPGWDWPTLIGLYPNVDVYTTQFRALEAYCRDNPRSATGRFVLAYHYLCDGSLDAAVIDLKQVVALKPDDTISSRLLQQLEAAKQQGPTATPPAAPPPASEIAPGTTTPPAGAKIDGNWTARPTPDTTIVLALHPGGTFDWQATEKGQTRKFSGISAYGASVLTLNQDKEGPVLVGRVTWQDANHMTFRVIGSGPEDHGLSFSR